MNSPTPNILLICADELRPDALGCFGNSFCHFPNIDHLAKSKLVAKLTDHVVYAVDGSNGCVQGLVPKIAKFMANKKI